MVIVVVGNFVAVATPFIFVEYIYIGCARSYLSIVDRDRRWRPPVIIHIWPTCVLLRSHGQIVFDVLFFMLYDEVVYVVTAGVKAHKCGKEAQLRGEGGELKGHRKIM